MGGFSLSKVGERTEVVTLQAPVATFTGVPHPKEDFSHYLAIIWKHRYMIALITSLFVLSAIVASKYVAPQYDAVARIAISKDANTSLRVGESGENDMAFDYSLELDTQTNILKSDSLGMDVIHQLHLADNPAFNKNERGLSKLTPQQKEDRLLTKYQNALTVTKIPRTRLIEIVFRTTDPALSAQLCNGLTSAYIEQSFKAKYDSTIKATDWLSAQLAELQQKVSSSEQALVEYQRQNGIVRLDEKEDITVQRLEQLNKDYTDAQADRIEKESLYRLASSDPSKLPSLSSNPLWQRLHEQQSDLSTTYAQLSTQFGPSYPKVLETSNALKEINNTIQAEIDRSVSSAKLAYLAALSREDMLAKALETQKHETNELSEKSIYYTQLKREADGNRALYDSLNQKLKEATLTSSLKPSNVQIVDLARVPEKPATPNLPKNIAYSFALGLLVGITAAFTLDHLDNTVKTVEHVQQLSAWSPLGTIPLHVAQNDERALAVRDKEMNADVDLIAHQRPQSDVSEAYRAVRTSILLSSTGKPPRVILLTSALPSEGKTTTSINTAIVFAQRGDRVLLVDADLRRSTIHQKLGIPQGPGLSGVLSGGATFEDAIVHAPGIANLDILPAGYHPPNPAELLSSDVMHKGIERWRALYDFVIIDTPPILAVTDAVVLSSRMDAVLIVVRSGKTLKHAIKRTTELFERLNIRILGYVLNGVDFSSTDAKYYHYQYGYRDSVLSDN